MPNKQLSAYKKNRRTKEYLDTITEDSAMPLSQSVATERTIIRPICLKPPLNGVVSLKVVSFLLLLSNRYSHCCMMKGLFV